jgi:ABC-2 type transport system permease protein
MTPLQWLRIFFVGGLTSYRALFNWISPWILIPSFLVAPLFQILLFAYIGRNAHLQSDEFFVIGNALQYASIPCLFAMANTIADERNQQTLGILLSTPAPRVALFLGRSLPVIANGFLVAAFGLTVGGAMLGIDVPTSALLPILLVTVVCAFSCTGLGLVNAALGLRVRETAVLSNIIFGVLLVFCGVNVPLDRLPGWMAAVAEGLPLTHGIAAARRLANGASLGAVGADLGLEILVGAAYVGIGLGMLRIFEAESRRRATLEIA